MKIKFLKLNKYDFSQWDKFTGYKWMFYYGNPLVSKTPEKFHCMLAQYLFTSSCSSSMSCPYSKELKKLKNSLKPNLDIKTK